MNIIDIISKEFNQFLIDYFKITPELASKCSLELNIDPAKENFGDLSSNCALILTKELKKNPRELATEVTNNFKNNYIEKIEVAGPGFLNLFLTNTAYQELCKNIFESDQDFFKPNNISSQKYNIEFISVNPTGPIHFGHGRGAIIGDVLTNILKFTGNQVTKEYYINDAGAQITKLGNSFKIRCQQQLGQAVELPEDAYHGQYLTDLAIETVKLYCKDDKSTKEFLKKDDKFFQEYAKEKMLELIKKTVADYGISFDLWFSEKSLHESGAIKQALDILEKNGYLFEQDGAKWFKSTQFGDDKDRVVIKSTGEPTYLAPDIAYLENKASRGFDNIVMLLGHDHHSYAVRLEGLRQALGVKANLKVILFQLVKMKASGEIVRMSKRAGNIVTLDDIIEVVGKDVARFFYLNRKADAQLEFDLDLASKKTEENPVYYAQYAYVRTKSIIEKAKLTPELSNITSQDAQYIEEPEHLLLKKIIQLKDILQNISQNLQTHVLAYYTVELATTFHSYYSKNRVIDLENIAQSRGRLLLIMELRNTLGLCLDILGLSKPEKM
ncbi:MAG: Arginine-tRNA ligase [candidate division TM6 bacterium GW2011_GWF2_30_66]|nr:MAG: Arginine-tRNA ligase [candidate division TM6 bacterium GW2011_GWF2_30_66]